MSYKSMGVHLRSQVRPFSWLKPEEPVTAGGVSGLGRKFSDLSACKGSLELKTVEVVRNNMDGSLFERVTSALEREYFMSKGRRRHWT